MSSFPSLSPGMLMVPTGAMPDTVGMIHVTSAECPWREVVHDDVLLVVAVRSVSQQPQQLTALHMRTGKLIDTNDITFWWLEEA